MLAVSSVNYICHLKRKYEESTVLLNKPKKHCFVKQGIKRKCSENIEKPVIKKKKTEKCLVHEEKYICDIYECSGIYSTCVNTHMPYIY